MLRKLLKATALVLVISMLTSTVAMAAPPTQPAFTDPNGDLWYSSEDEAAIEEAYIQSMFERLASQTETDSRAQMMAVGDYLLVTRPPQAEQPLRIYWDDEKLGNFLSIAGYVMFVFGLVFTTIESVVVDVALALGQGYGDISNSQTRARTGHSYTYLVKQGQVLTSSGWNTYYVAASRRIVPQTYALYEDTAGNTRQLALTYPAITTQYSPNWTDESHISWQSLNRWYNNLNCGQEDWNGVKPDPDPQFVKPVIIEVSA